uniref:Protein FAM189A1 n=1 Tax=Mesocestoides corti TaxID=53468 RepID=A0A5K3EKD5_MESCO
MASISANRYDVPLLWSQAQNSIYLPTLIESAALEELPAMTSGSSICSLDPYVNRHPRFCYARIRKSLKRLISKNGFDSLRHRISGSSGSVQQNNFELQSRFPLVLSARAEEQTHSIHSPFNELDQDINASRSKRSCLGLPCFSRFRDFYQSLSKSLGHLTGRRMPNENLFVLSMIQILCGLAAVVLSGVAVTKVVFLYQMATGLWSGFLMLATGFHGILTARRCTSPGLIEDGILKPDISPTLLTTPNSPYYLSSQISVAPNLHFDIPRGSFLRRRIISKMQPPRLHQVMLHVLLLVIGILETAVSVACVVLCCQQVFPPSSTSFLSVISYLRNRGATLVAGGTEYLLAVAAQPGKPPPVLLDYAMPQPYLHPSAHHFLPRPGRRIMILTQAETGIHALASVQAVASIVSSPRSQVAAEELRGSASPSVLSAAKIAKNRKESHKLKTRLCSLLPRLSSPNSVNGRSSNNSNLLYVLSSTSPSDPPMVFPPFPPAYSPDEESNSCSTSFAHPQVLPPNHMNSQNLNLRECLPSVSAFSRYQSCYRLGCRTSAASVLRHTFSVSRNRTRSSLIRRPNAAEAAVGLFGDRILQPVLVIEDTEVDENSEPLTQPTIITQTPPPSYSSTLEVPGSTTTVCSP